MKCPNVQSKRNKGDQSNQGLKLRLMTQPPIYPYTKPKPPATRRKRASHAASRDRTHKKNPRKKRRKRRRKKTKVKEASQEL